jgi:hypothetical protein
MSSSNPRISWQIREGAIDEEDSEYVQYKTYTEEGSLVP